VALQDPPLGSVKPYFEYKRSLELAMVGKVTEDKGGRTTAVTTERSGSKLT
jgi:hypothetical protein